MNIYCSSCGTLNKLPDGKNSVYCSNCGTLIEAPIQMAKEPDTKFKFKPEITKNTLSLTNRGIESLSEIISLFSDNELYGIQMIVLSDNKLTSLKGISRFINLKVLDLSGNQLTELDEIPDSSLTCIFLDNNKISTFSDLTAQNFNKIISRSGHGLIIRLAGNPIHDFESFKKIKLEKKVSKIKANSNSDFILQAAKAITYSGKEALYIDTEDSYISIDLEHPILKELGFNERKVWSADNSVNWLFYKEANHINQKRKNEIALKENQHKFIGKLLRFFILPIISIISAKLILPNWWLIFMLLAALVFYFILWLILAYILDESYELR